MLMDGSQRVGVIDYGRLSDAREVNETRIQRIGLNDLPCTPHFEFLSFCIFFRIFTVHEA
jgi:hypothetical protein